MPGNVKGVVPYWSGCSQLTVIFTHFICSLPKMNPFKVASVISVAFDLEGDFDLGEHCWSVDGALLHCGAAMNSKSSVEKSLR